ncbi:MAG: LysR family transcriptional regulator [Clostridia bacterium]|nr:LysR family transcriptional regulator [Clostridia bacterium]
MQLQLHQLELFVMISDLKSMSQAAAKSYISVPSLVKQMNSLEQSLNFKLFTRNNHGVSLTAAGEAFYDDALDIIGRVYAAAAHAEEISKSASRTLKIGVQNIENTLLEACKTYSHISSNQVDVQCVRILMSEKHNALLQKRIDLYWKADYPPTGDDVESEVLYRSKPMIMMSHNHKLARRKEVEWTDLYGQKLMISPKGVKKYDDELREYLHSVHPDIVLTDSKDPVTNVLDLSLGRTFMLTTQMQRMPNDAICVVGLSPDSWKAPLDVICVYRK